MTTFGCFLSGEEHTPSELVRQAQLAERAGFEALWISDHYHPWNDEQGESAFVWTVLGAIGATTSLPVTTAVTCPTVRIHPAVVAQAAATTAALLEGRFRLGVGTGEALNEHVLGDRWPPLDVRLEMLEEAIAVMRELWTGEVVNHHGTHYTVEQARLYTLPEKPVPLYVSAFGPKAVESAGRHGDGYCGVTPDASLVQGFRDAGGTGPTQGGTKVCWSRDAAAARATVHRLWANQGLPGELSQILPTPQHFMQASSIVTEEMATESVACGDDVEAHVAQLQQYVDAGYDEVYVGQIGPEQDGFFDFYATEVLPRLRG